MSMPWLKLFAEFASDPKVQSMSEPMQRRLIMLFCLHCSGSLASLNDEELALAMRIRPAQLEETREVFRRKGFIGQTWVPKNWEKRQQPSDLTAAERMRRYRERHRNVTRNDPVTDRNVTGNATSPLRVDIEVDKEREEPPPISPPSGGSRAAFKLPEWIPLQDWEDYIKARRKKPTLRAKELLVAKLSKLRDDGDDPGAVLQQSIEAGWTGVFALKDRGRNGSAPRAAQPIDYYDHGAEMRRLLES